MSKRAASLHAAIISDDIDFGTVNQKIESRLESIVSRLEKIEDNVALSEEAYKTNNYMLEGLMARTEDFARVKKDIEDVKKQISAITAAKESTTQQPAIEPLTPVVPEQSEKKPKRAPKKEVIELTKKNIVVELSK
jgi:hypothetical protein